MGAGFWGETPGWQPVVWAGSSSPLALCGSNPFCPETVLLSATLRSLTGVSASISRGHEPKHEPKVPADLCLHLQHLQLPGPGIFLEESGALSSSVQVLSLGALLTSWWMPAELAMGILGDGAGSRPYICLNGLP